MLHVEGSICFGETSTTSPDSFPIQEEAKLLLQLLKTDIANQLFLSGLDPRRSCLDKSLALESEAPLLGLVLQGLSPLKFSTNLKTYEVTRSSL